MHDTESCTRQTFPLQLHNDHEGGCLADFDESLHEPSISATFQTKRKEIDNDT